MKKIFKTLIIISIVFCVFPLVASAASTAKVKNTTLWGKFPEPNGNTGNLGYSTTAKYYTKEFEGNPREAKYIAGFMDDTNDIRLFCIEPGAQFKSNSTISDYTISSTAPTLKNSKWTIKEDELLKVISCYYSYTNIKDLTGTGNYYGTLATQALVWELVTKERSSINATNILGGDYAPHDSSGSTYKANSADKSLYELIAERKEIFAEYKNTLECAARFNIAAPKWSSEVKSVSKENKQKLTYDDKTDTFSKTFSHGSKISPDLFKYYTYKINSTKADCKKGATVDGITCSCNEKSCTFSTKNAISTPVEIEFIYTYKGNGKTHLNTATTNYYTKDVNKEHYQSLMTGHKEKSFFLHIYTDDKPTYQLKINKVDSNNKIIKSGTAKFNVYSDSKMEKKVGTITTKEGVGTLTGLTTSGKYYVQEIEAPKGYVLNSQVQSVDVATTNTTGSTSFATLNVKNKDIILHMDKYTIDESGNKVLLDNDYCKVNICENGKTNGPIFTIKSDDDYVCVVESDTPGSYVFDSISSKCDDNTISEIKTCEGKFDIKNIPKGEYTVTETTSVCGAVLPSNPSIKVTVNETETTRVTMTNGFSGVILNKVTENGNILTGGKFSLQKKENGVYKDVLLKNVSGIKYTYDAALSSEAGGSYLLDNTTGSINVTNLPVGEYRFVEKEAPAGYDIIKDKDSTAVFTVSDKASDTYEVQLINRKSKTKGSFDSAELIVTIITGRKVINYVLVISGLLLILGLLIVLRKKIKK